MESGVLRPGDQVIRRGSERVPLHVTREVSDYLNRSVEVLFGPESKPDQQKTKVVSRPQHKNPTPYLPTSSRFSWKGLLKRLGWLAQSNDGACAESSSPELLAIRLEGRVQKLQLLLETEQALCEAQRQQLTSQTNRIDVLEAELAIERESSAQLVDWLRHAEQELSEMRQA